MSGFWNLVGFEYRKIFRKKSTLIALTLALLASVLSCWGTLMGQYYVDGKPYESNYQAMLRDRANARALSGRVIDETLLLEAAAAYATLPEGAANYTATEEYQQNARPYSELYGIARRVYRASQDGFGAAEFAALTPQQAKEFYALRDQAVAQNVEQTQMSRRAKDAVLAMDAGVETPWIFSYSEGYTRFFSILYTTGVIAAFVMAVCVAPMFAGEYTSGADQLILSSKFGKNRAIGAKLLAGFSLAGLLSLFFMAQTYLQCMLT